MRVIDETFMDCPWYGSRQMARHLQRLGYAVGRRRVRRLMAQMGLVAIYQRPRTSDPHPEHRIYPYLLRDMKIERPNQVWCADVTYLPMRRGFLYLVAIMDWATRKVLAWRLSNTMDAAFCVEVLEEAMARYGTPDIFNTESGQPVHFAGLHRRATGGRSENQHGWQGALDGQCLHRAPAGDPAGRCESQGEGKGHPLHTLCADAAGDRCRTGAVKRIQTRTEEIGRCRYARESLRASWRGSSHVCTQILINDPDTYP